MRYMLFLLRFPGEIQQAIRKKKSASPKSWIDMLLRMTVTFKFLL